MQFYEDVEFLSRGVAAYLMDGLKSGSAAVVIMTPSHWTLVRGRLIDAGLRIDEAVERHELTVLDAAETLATFMVNGSPDPARFREIVGEVIRTASQSLPEQKFRAFGEMVDLLWQEGNLTGAIRLEQLWNDLLKEHRFSLYCAYKVSPWDPALSEQASRGIFREHSHVIPVDDFDRLNRAVDSAMREVLGTRQAGSLRPLITANRNRLAVMPGAQTAILWLRDNLPDTVEDVLVTARRHYHSSEEHVPPAQAPAR